MTYTVLNTASRVSITINHNKPEHCSAPVDVKLTGPWFDRLMFSMTEIEIEQLYDHLGAARKFARSTARERRRLDAAKVKAPAEGEERS